MPRIAIMIMVIVTTIIIFAVTAVILSLVVLKPAPKKQDTSQSPYSVSYITRDPVMWTENTRNNSNGGNGMPPCFDISPACKNIYGIINSRNLVQRYQKFLDTLSIMCCQRKNNVRDCSKVLTGERIQDLVNMGGDPYDKDAVEKAKAYAKVENTDASKLITTGINIIERHIIIMQNDDDLTREEKGQIRGFVNEFYGANLLTMYQQCL